MYEIKNANLLVDVNVVIVNFDDLDDCFRDNYVDFFKRHENEDLSEYHMHLGINYYGEYSSCGSSGHLDIQFFDPDDYEGDNPHSLPNSDKFLQMFLEDVFDFKPSVIAVDGAMVYIISEPDDKDY